MNLTKMDLHEERTTLTKALVWHFNINNSSVQKRPVGQLEHCAVNIGGAQVLGEDCLMGQVFSTKPNSLLGQNLL